MQQQIESIFITPEQGLFQGSRETMTGEKALCLALLEGVLLDIQKARQTRRDTRIFNETMEWVEEKYELTKKQEAGLLRFSFCCTALGFDEDYIREQLKCIGEQSTVEQEQSAAPSFVFDNTWRPACGKWGDRYMVNLDGSIFDCKNQEIRLPGFNPNTQELFMRLHDEIGGWTTPLGKIVARTWGGTNAVVKVHFLDGNTQNCAFANLTWDAEKYGGMPGVIAEETEEKAA